MPPPSEKEGRRLLFEEGVKASSVESVVKVVANNI
jgi:hypothetical protein